MSERITASQLAALHVSHDAGPVPALVAEVRRLRALILSVDLACDAAFTANDGKLPEKIDNSFTDKTKGLWHEATLIRGETEA